MHELGLGLSQLMSEAAAPAVVAVRDATLADLEFLVDGNAAMALETENLTLNKDTLRLGCAAMLHDRSKGFYLMADCEGVTSGQLMVTYEHSDWRNGEHSRDMTLAPLTTISSHFMQEHFGPDLPPPCHLPPSNIMNDVWPAGGSSRYTRSRTCGKGASTRRCSRGCKTWPKVPMQRIDSTTLQLLTPLPPNLPIPSIARRLRHPPLRREPQRPRPRNVQEVRYDRDGLPHLRDRLCHFARARPRRRRAVIFS